ncbi:MAG TPA: ABC transporter [Bacteroidales bacterium]|nr:MAG: ABC transporter [Bacteroidetes bacterium GWF2_33_38]OFY75037.1 MAG: ABC transporter [Bacteroidetes bacterium RIFOXYA12_FULL_33_9]OFY90913.1 MAG: ABC transporter [Bacteroidetes bacterium RIFOXYA2_FULL_33_7]HBF87209.1 ABC transporter [Bacteroidales bacterium]
MSEEILKALMQLFALIVKQDSGVDERERDYVRIFLQQQLNHDVVNEYLAMFDEYAKEKEKKKKEGEEESSDTEEKKSKLTSVKDSVKVLGICKKINKTLTQNQKIVVLVRLFELVNSDKNFAEQRMAIITTVADVFNISKDEIQEIENFIIVDNVSDILDNNTLKIGRNFEKKETEETSLAIENEAVMLLRVKSVDLYFLRYIGLNEVMLNGLVISGKRIYLFANGSTIKPPYGKPIYYSDVVSFFMQDSSQAKLSFNVKNIEYKFKNGNIGLRDINFAERQGRLVGIMGASGAGKTTLLSVLSGIEKPSSGEVLINGINLHTEKKKIKGLIGYIPQDDLLIEELSVFQNLYYSTKLCFKNKSENEINEIVDKTLSSLGLIEIKHLKVGSPMNKTISGGQRKRLNIALELIREPSILFVDEPTSGLSSRDSENVMDLLRELTMKGKLIYVVIHQPSSEIYKMFDNMIILDTGGYLVYSGNPVEAVMYFKRIDNQINSEVGECQTCGNVNPELIFNIIESKVIDEFGKYTDKRKVTPQKWNEYYTQHFKIPNFKNENQEVESSLKLPSWFKQSIIYTIRDFLSKISNKQYIYLNLLEAPLLGFILSIIIRYIADPNSSVYIFRENENIPPYIFMCIIVSLFLGLTVSAEEIFRDRKILKRETFLNLSRSSYLSSKIIILLVLSAIQSILFVFVGNSILGVIDATFSYWFALFSISAFANMLGLNISASFNSAVTIYILIPLLIIPQMVLGGAMFSFDKLNRALGSVGKVPFIAEFMSAKWAYEGLMVQQFKDNNFEKIFYELEKKESVADYHQVYYIPELIERVNVCMNCLKNKDNDSIFNVLDNNLQLIKNEIVHIQSTIHDMPFGVIDKLDAKSFSNMIGFVTKDYLQRVDKYYALMFKEANTEKEKIINYMLSSDPALYRGKKDAFHNESVSDIVKKIYEKNKIIEYEHHLIQQVDPIFQNPIIDSHYSFRSHFFAPQKHFMGKYYDTYWFNMLIIWIMTLFLYITLYFELLKKLILGFEKLKIRKDK